MPARDPARRRGDATLQAPETIHGLVSDVSLKRKLRNSAELARGGEAGHRIDVQAGAILNEKPREAHVSRRVDDAKAPKKRNPKGDDEARALRDGMCVHFFDVRTFGAVMSTGINCGQVKGRCR